MSMENLPPAPYPSQVEEWQRAEDEREGVGHEVDSLANTDDGGVSLSDGDCDIGPNAETATRSSKRSRKSSHKAPSRVESGSIIWTRAPPKKSYEPDPFLSIDNLPVEKKKQFIAQQQQNDERSTIRTVSRGPNVPFNSPAPPGRVGSSHVSNSRPSTGSGSGWNRLVPKHPKYMKANVLQGTGPNNVVKAPFKQSLAARDTALNKYELSPRPQSPGIDMKERTTQATYHVARSIAKQPPITERVISGRLLKAKLKPIVTVEVEGPSINNCRGIQPGNRSSKNKNMKSIEEADGEGIWAPFAYYKRLKESQGYMMARSRTLQRRRHILHTVGAGPLRDMQQKQRGAGGEQERERPGTSESLHRTSIASDLSGDEQERLQQLNEELQQLERNAEEMLAMAEAAETSGLEEGEFPQAYGYPRVPTNSEVFLTEEKEDDALTTNEKPESHLQEKSVNGSRKSSAKSKPGSAKSCLIEPGSRPQTEGSQRKVRFSASSTASRAKSSSRREVIAVEIPKEDGEMVEDRVVGDPVEDPAVEDQDQTVVVVELLDEKQQQQHQQQQQQVDDDEDIDDDNANMNNSNNTGRTETLRMSISELSFGFDHPDVVRNHRNAQQKMKVRPTSAHKTWEDVQKPDANVSDLAISGVHKTTGGSDDDEGDDCKISVQVTKKNRLNSAIKHGRSNSAAARIFNRGSPREKPAFGPKEFMAIEKQREIQRSRAPQSAMVVYDPIEVEPQRKALEARPQSPHRNVGLGAGRGGRKRAVSAGLSSMSRRPNTSSMQQRRTPSATTKKAPFAGNTASRSHVRCSSAHTYDPRVAAPVQCCVCALKFKKYLSLEEAQNTDKIMCKDCKTFRGIVDDYNAIAGRKKSSLNNDDANDTPAQLAIEYKEEPIDEDELGIIEDEVQSDEEEEPFEVLNNMDDIERSLMEIRGQIRDSQARFKQKQKEEEEEEEKRVRFEDDDVFLTEATKLVESTISESIHEESDTREDTEEGEMSTVLLDCKELPPKTPAVKPLLNHMQVYHLNQDDGENKSNISTFPMSVMGEESQEPTGFLEMLMAELPEEEETKTEPAVKRVISSPLEVNAQPARMTAAKCEDVMPTSIAPFSPLCFKINARPPAGYLYYFAYGIDMNPNRFSTYIGRPLAERSWGLMMGFKLTFNRKGGDAGCFPNVEPDACSSVEGCLYLITPAELHTLINHMGGQKALQQVMLPVWLLNCDSPSELGVMQYCVPALLFLAHDTAIHTEPHVAGNSYAVDQCVKGGGDVLSPAYIQNLHHMERQRAQDDTEEET